MKTNIYESYIQEPSVQGFIQKHAIFYNTGKFENRSYNKSYLDKSAKGMVEKMVDIHNFLYPNQPCVISGENVCMVSQAIENGICVLDEKNISFLCEQVGKQTAKLHTILDEHYNDLRKYPTVYDVNFFAETISLFELMGNYSIVQKEVVKKLINSVKKALEYVEIGDIGGVHGDIHFENVLVNGKYIRFIDFDMIGYGNRLIDFSVPYLALRGDSLLFRDFVQGYMAIRDVRVSWLKFKYICLLVRVLCICSNINEHANYNWLPHYIVNTSYFVQMMSESPPLELKFFFRGGKE